MGCTGLGAGVTAATQRDAGCAGRERGEESEEERLEEKAQRSAVFWTTGGRVGQVAEDGGLMSQWQRFQQANGMADGGQGQLNVIELGVQGAALADTVAPLPLVRLA